MGTQQLQRVFRGDEFIATTPRTGSQGNAVWRTENMVRRGRGNHRYWEVLRGELDLNESAPLVALTGTVAVTEDSPIVTGTDTLFLTELHLGQRVIIIDEDGDQTIPIFVKRIISDTSYEAWRPSTATLSGQTGWRMYRMFAMNQDRAMMLWGNAIKLDKGSILAVGDGTLFVNGAELPGTSLEATREPKIALFDPDGTYTVFTLGMDTPAAPALSAIAGGTKGMQGGNYSLVITPARKQTDGFNNPSQRADVTIATNDMVRITFPAMDTANGQNAWQIWVTTFTQSLGADLGYLNGPWHFLMQITDEDVSSAGGTFDVEWLTAEVVGNEIVSFDNDPPPQAEFVQLLNDGPVWLSCRGPSFTRGATEFIDPSPGPMIAPSKQTNAEAAPAGIQFATSPPETIIGGFPGQGRIFVMTPNHLNIAQSTPDEAVPILLRPYWNDGFANPEAAILVDGEIYAFTTSGPAKSSGDDRSGIEAQREWAAFMSEFTDDWTEEAGHMMVAHFPRMDAIAFFHVCDSLNAQGFWTTFVLLWGRSQGEWIGTRRISQEDRDSIVCGVCTVGEDLHLLMGGRRIG